MLASCGGKSPTQPAASGPTASADPVARVQVKVDDGTQREALASISDVAVDASASTGSGALTFSIDFGDGTSATTATARHTYGSPGTFTVVATVAYAQGRKATGSSQVTVKAVTGRWYQAEYVRRSDRVEVRQLTVTSQDGLSVRGIYGTTGNTDRSFAGTLTPPREIRIAISGGAGLIDPSGQAERQRADLTLAAQGDSVDGERLDSTRSSASPPTPLPGAAEARVDAVRGGPIVRLARLFDGTRQRDHGRISSSSGRTSGHRITRDTRRRELWHGTADSSRWLRPQRYRFVAAPAFGLSIHRFTPCGSDDGTQPGFHKRAVNPNGDAMLLVRADALIRPPRPPRPRPPDIRHAPAGRSVSRTIETTR
jgi:hypothetical protein